MARCAYWNRHKGKRPCPTLTAICSGCCGQPWQREIEHLVKVRGERETSFPNEGLIRYWEREITAFEQGIARAQRRSERKG
jgi:hypothetical protein